MGLPTPTPSTSTSTPIIPTAEEQEAQARVKRWNYKETAWNIAASLVTAAVVALATGFMHNYRTLDSHETRIVTLEQRGIEDRTDYRDRLQRIESKQDRLGEMILQLRVR